MDRFAVRFSDSDPAWLFFVALPHRSKCRELESVAPELPVLITMITGLLSAAGLKDSDWTGAAGILLVVTRSVGQIGIGERIIVGIRVNRPSKLKTTVLMAKEATLTAFIVKKATVTALMAKSKIMTMVELSKSTTVRKIRSHPHAVVSPYHILSSRGLDHGR